MRMVIALVLTAAVFGLSLRADSRTPDNSAAEWAGSYWYRVANSTMDFSLTISPEGRFTLFMGGCFGSSEINHGRVTFRKGILLLDPELPVENGFTFESPAMIPKRFGSHLYLVGTDRVDEFAQAVNSQQCTNYCPNFFAREEYSPSLYL